MSTKEKATRLLLLAAFFIIGLLTGRHNPSVDILSSGALNANTVVSPNYTFPANWPVCPPKLKAGVGCDYISTAPPEVIERLNYFFREVDPSQASKNEWSTNRQMMKYLVLWETLMRVKPARSNVVELGCFTGTTTLGFRFVMNELGYKYPDHVLHVYDSWEGLPPKGKEDSGGSKLGEKGGEILKAGIDAFLTRFRKKSLDPPYIHKGWFGDILKSEYPQDIVFAYYDGDWYKSIKDSFEQTYSKMIPGGRILIDDYLYDRIEGPKNAVDDFLSDKPEGLGPTYEVDYRGKTTTTLIPFSILEGVVPVA